MESISIVRLSSNIKDSSPTIKNDVLTFKGVGISDKATIQRKVAAFDALRISTFTLKGSSKPFGKPLPRLTDDDIKDARMKKRF